MLLARDLKSLLYWDGELWFDSKSGQSKDFKINEHNFPVWHSELKWDYGATGAVP